MHVNGIQKQSLARLPLILKELYQLEKRNREVVSPAYLAAHLHQPERDVRTDLAVVGIVGGSDVACNVRGLIAAIEKMLGYQNNDVFVVGTDAMVSKDKKSLKINALELNVVAVFDENPPSNLVADSEDHIYPFSKMAD